MLIHDGGVFNDEELLLFDNANRKRNPRGMLPYRNYDRFVLGDMDESQYLVEFHFKKEDIYNLVVALHLPEVFRCTDGVIAHSMEALCSCLKHLSYHCRYADLIPRFGRSVPQLCMISNLVIDYIFDTREQPFLSRDNLQTFVDAIHQNDAALDSCWSFANGTVRPISRPKENQ